MVKVRFQADFVDAREVFIAGDFNGWDPTARRLKRVKKGRPTFVALIDLEPGRYEFKYVVDGAWVCCPCSARVPNDQGTSNSVVDVEAE